MWLVLTDAPDPLGPWVTRGLSQLGLHPVHHVTGAELALARRWEQRMEGADLVSRIDLSGGLCLESGKIRGIVNRLQMIPSEFGLGVKAPDRDYVQQEAGALLLGWLHSLRCPVVNPAAANGLCGAWRHPLEWFVLARRAGLPVPEYRLDADAPRLAAVQPSLGLSAALRRLPVVEFLVAGGEFLGPPSAPPVPVSVAGAVVELARLAATPLLGVQLAPAAQSEWMFLGASLLPDLRGVGRPVLEVLARLLRGSVSGSGIPRDTGGILSGTTPGAAERRNPVRAGHRSRKAPGIPRRAADSAPSARVPLLKEEA